MAELESKPTDAESETEHNWHDVAMAVLETFGDAIEILERGETINDWDDAQEEWAANYRPDGNSVTFEHDSGAWVRIQRSARIDAYHVFTRESHDDAVPQRSIYSTPSFVCGLGTCQPHAVSKLLTFTRDGEF